MAKLSLFLKLSGRGCLEATITADGTRASMIASYLSDAMGGLAEAAVALLRGADQARYAWQDEPGAYRWILRRSGDTLDVTLLRFEDTFSRKLDEQGALLFHAECELMRFATQVKGQLHQLLNEFGERGYREQWGHDFPAREFEQLKELIAQRKHAQRQTG